MRFIIPAVCFFLALKAWSYPEFIGYGYSSCLTCHVNSMGSGPLNDYGRALWSAEIASRAFYPKSMSDEEIATKSGFAGSFELPSWFKPHMKYRDLQLTSGLKSSNERKRFLLMQQDIGLTSSDPDGRYLGTFTYGSMLNRTDGSRKFYAREYYLRIEIAPSWWIYVGLMDRVYGIRNIDHSSLQRSPQGFNPYLGGFSSGHWQSQGVVLNRITETTEWALNVFTGNPYEDKSQQQKGGSGFFETDIGELKRLGASLMNAQSEELKKNQYAIHYRQALSKGSALWFEYGFIQDQTKSFDGTWAPVQSGSYNALHTLINLTRGYNLRTSVERYNREFKASAPDIWKWNLGLLAFPAPRFEFRGDLINKRSFSSSAVSDDSWEMQGLIHVSL
jgi:hypothetical protein